MKKIVAAKENRSLDKIECRGASEFMRGLEQPVCEVLTCADGTEIEVIGYVMGMPVVRNKS